MKLAPNAAILPIRNGQGGNLVLAWDDTNLVLIDAGYPNDFDEITQAIAAEGFNAANLTHLIITHQDWDHVGCIAELQKIAPKMQIYAHSDELEYLDGTTNPIKLANMLAKYETLDDGGKDFCNMWKNFYANQKIGKITAVADKETWEICGGIEFVHVPGHTPGHIAPYLQASKILVCGDAANIHDGQMVGSNPVYTHDMPLAEKSLAKMQSYPLSGIVAYHGGFLAISK
ncbi:MAG: MBL fold metallo-hydrolase [Defluviitaleaceae bacterium]|nr:MBL fold metallo-hydrolase [Defluviitaleaceae bacterium]